jgi:hypothetical protein
LLGDSVVLVPIPRGKKKPSVPWGNLQPTAMRNLAHIKSLNKGNIGVIQGKKSGGICSIDIDHDDEVAPFLDLNPTLAKSLRTKGQRGENIWLQMSGHYPGLSIIQTHMEAPWGEWRADGAQTVIYGIHPSGRHYSFVYEAKPACVEFGQIVWPAHVIPPVHTLLPECTQGTQEDSGGHIGTQATHATQFTHEVMLQGLFSTVEQIVAACIPTQKKKNHHLLFKLARGVIALEQGRGGSKFTIDELMNVFEQWYANAKPTDCLDEAQAKDDYMTEFMDACRLAKHPLGGTTLVEAWHRATSNPPPPEAMIFESPDKRNLVALCRELQILAKEEPFFLSCRVAAQLLKHDTHSTAATWLGAFQTLKLIQEVKKGSATGRQASEYRYLKV